jgi:Na+/melibiose symporter-like transporter
MPFYLTIVLEAGGVTNPDQLTKKTPWQLAVIPLLEYIASVGASFLLERLGMRFTRQVMVLGGAVFVALGSFPMFFLTPETIWLMFPIAILIGIGFSLQLNNAMGFIADFIGPYGKSGAFVYGAISL